MSLRRFKIIKDMEMLPIYMLEMANPDGGISIVTIITIDQIAEYVDMGYRVIKIKEL
jgi:hypothetical protein